MKTSCDCDGIHIEICISHEQMGELAQVGTLGTFFACLVSCLTSSVGKLPSSQRKEVTARPVPQEGAGKPPTPRT